MSLKQDDKKSLRTIGHQLNPVVTVAENGLSATVLAEIDRALNDHELIKIKIVTEDRDNKKALIAEVVKQTNATLVQTIGHIALLLRKVAKPNPKLSNLKRFSHL
ncbi:ribosome assembly RNA-binding protein YhbY [Reinekea sp.]|jgi:RNA-binding protein|uniref:ribosome assembly RNA-binding protein YhbY n=1 Tax=Reinekea sp. TaxID=1970455 RepID=UPI002A7F8AC9|nr:ribosome assembly RNA-binding protein YhbY [Reinekea sp.]